MYSNYWNSVWNIDDIDEYRTYIAGFNHRQSDVVEIFREHGIRKVCDAACGFGANSLMFASNGFQVSGFDISEDSVKITTELLAEYGFDNPEYKVASIMNTPYKDETFDAVTSRAVMDHLKKDDFAKALKELKRITRGSGLIYMTFDPLEADDLSEIHEVLKDGSFLYTGGERKGLLFHYYSDEELSVVLEKENIIFLKTDDKGNRHVIITG